MSIEEKRVLAAWRSVGVLEDMKRGPVIGEFSTFHAVKHQGSLALEE